MKIAVAGLGLIGKERVVALNKLKNEGLDVSICGVFDPYLKNIEEFQTKHNVKAYRSFNEIIELKPDWIFIATPHDTALELGKTALEKGFKVLIEKPLGRTLAEAKILFDAARDKNNLWVGFNYRFFGGINKMLNDVKNNRFGKIISVNFLLGHGCHPNITDGWKLDPVRAGGGCLIDPGIHFLDLARIISDDKIKVVSGINWQGFWKTGIEEETHLLFKNDDAIINMQISIVKWRSTFRIEVNGTDAYGIIEGRNRSYGNQKYTFGERWGWQKAKSQLDSEILEIETDGEDVFVDETRALLFPDISKKIQPCNSIEAINNMEILEECRNIIGN
jgi:predicted dehydrogenase